MLVLSFADFLPQAQRLANRLGVALKKINLHHFPDGESLVQIPTLLPEHLLICCSLDQPNNKLIELLLCARTARESGAKRITLVVPYLCYMRQDIANNPGEAVSQRIIGKMLADLFNDVITVDPHLHRIAKLDEAIPLQNAIALTAAAEIGAYLKQQLDTGILLGPDSESEQWVSNIANKIHFDYAIADKIRRGDRQVDITLPERNYSNKSVVIIDDMASTGRTLAQTASLLQAAGAGAIYAAITHPLFCDDAEKHIMDAGIKAIWSTDSINHSTSVIQLDKLLAEAVKSIL